MYWHWLEMHSGGAGAGCGGRAGQGVRGHLRRQRAVVRGAPGGGRAVMSANGWSEVREECAAWGGVRRFAASGPLRLANARGVLEIRNSIL